MNKSKKYLNNADPIPEVLSKDFNIKEQIKETTEEKNIFLEESSAEVETNGPETKNGIIVNSLCVNVRREPSFDSESLEFLRKGDKVVILGKEKGFYKVQTNINKEAYIALDFIEEE